PSSSADLRTGSDTMPAATSASPTFHLTWVCSVRRHRHRPVRLRRAGPWTNIPTVDPDLRIRLASVLADESTRIAAEAAEIFSGPGSPRPELDERRRLAGLLVSLIGAVIRDDRLNAHTDNVSAVRRLATAREIDVERLFGLAYIVERSAI